MKSSFRLGWEEWQAALRERERVQVQQLEAQFKATRLAERAAEIDKYIEQILARTGKLAFMQEWEELQAAHRERERQQKYERVQAARKAETAEFIRWCEELQAAH